VDSVGRYDSYVASGVPDEWQDELSHVQGLAEELRAYLEETSDELALLHVHGASSKAIQDHVGKLLVDTLGFETEKVLTPVERVLVKARPDFYLRTSPGRGVLVEVERGGTTTNNHDLKDLWKAHLAPDAHHLFLIVPLYNFRADGSRRGDAPFGAVARRMSAFFGDPRRQVDVLSAHVFAY